MTRCSIRRSRATRTAAGCRTKDPRSEAFRSPNSRHSTSGRIDPSSAYWRQFPQQSPIDGARFPTLDALFAATATAARKVGYNIEIKTSPDAPGDTLDPETFARLVVERVRRAGLAERVTVQSFDWRALLAMRRLAPQIATSALTIESSDMNNIHDGRGRALEVAPGRAGDGIRGLGAPPRGGFGMPDLVAVLAQPRRQRRCRGAQVEPGGAALGPSTSRRTWLP